MFVKNDIKSLPFDRMATTIAKKAEEFRAERLINIKAAAEAANSRKLRQYTNDSSEFFDGEAGSDGVEEGVLEVVGLHDIDDIELTKEQRKECFNNARELVIKSFLEAYDIANKYTWIMPQLKAYFGNWEAIKGSDGFYSPIDTLSKNVVTDFDKGLYYLAMWSRSDLIGGPGVKLYQVGEYNNLVPLILSGFRTYQDIPYSNWSRTGIEAIVDAPLAAAMLADLPNFKTAQILEIRKDCLVVQSGAKKGQHRDPKTASMLYGIPNYTKYDLKHYPKLALVMLAQIWCAHPANRTPHMILDPKDWDRMPAPIIETDVVPKYKSSVIFKNKPSVQIPWEV